MRCVVYVAMVHAQFWYLFRFSTIRRYDVILERLFGLAIEKLIICCIPEKYSDDPNELIIVCNVFDAVLEHKQENCTDVLKESIALK